MEEKIETSVELALQICEVCAIHSPFIPSEAASNARAVGDSEAARRRSMRRAGQTFSGWEGRCPDRFNQECFDVRWQ